MTLRTLRARIERVERLSGKRVRRQVIFKRYADPAPIIALRGFTATIERHHGEGYERFKSRALAKLRDPIIMAVYSDK